MNFKDAIRRINKDFCNLFYAKYLKGLWGYNVGYKTVPAHIAIMRKELADWQEANDCSNSLCIESRGHVSFTCCSAGAVPILFTDRGNCCIDGYILNPLDGRCYLPGNSTPFPPTPCGFCPTGYTLNGAGNIAGCLGPNGDVINVVSTAGLYCTKFYIDRNGVTRGDPRFGSPIYKCPDLVQDFTILKTAEVSPPGQCVLNPCLEPFGSGQRYCGHLNINEVLIACFTR